VILAIDTSAGTSVALVGDGIVAEAATADTRSHAEHIGVFIDRVLTDAGVTPSDVAAVVTGIGPGPFTGLRVGIAAAIAFAVGRGIPIYGIPSHDAAAVGREVCTIVTDVRRRELAWTTYRDGVAVAGPFASRGASTMSARAQDDAMEMLLQVAISRFNVVQFSRAQHFQLYPPPHLFRCRSWQARPLTLTLE
jgi:tRNA threonylcarbamoyl adenosine modification protein YeaZ